MCVCVCCVYCLFLHVFVCVCVREHTHDTYDIMIINTVSVGARGVSSLLSNDIDMLESPCTYVLKYIEDN